MSTLAPNSYIVIAYDVPDSARMAYRPEHLVGAASAREAGTLVVAGGMMDDETATKLIGSTMLFVASSIEEVRKLVEADPYYQNGVWDKERITISPFFRAF